MKDNRFIYSPIIKRRVIKWPQGARLAVWVIPNIEHFEIDVGFNGGSAPDIPNIAFREYGNRVGIWRVMDVLDKYRIRATVALNSAVCEHYPVIIEEGLRRGWEFMGHGISNSQPLAGMGEEEEGQVVRSTLETIGAAIGKRPEGWLSPHLAETYNTPDILAREGIRYLCDWCCDDQPFPMKVKQGTLISVPYGGDMNDMRSFRSYHLLAEQFCQIVKDQFDVLYEEGAASGRVMAIALHPFLSGHASRINYLDKILDYITGHKDVWLATGSEIANWYRDHYLRAE